MELKRRERLEREEREHKRFLASGAQMTVEIKRAIDERRARDLLDEDENLNRYLTRAEFFQLFFGVNVNATASSSSASAAAAAANSASASTASASAPTSAAAAGGAAAASTSGASTATAGGAATTTQEDIERDEREQNAMLGPRLPPTVLLFVRDRLIWSLGVSRLNQVRERAAFWLLPSISHSLLSFPLCGKLQEDYDSAVTILDTLGLQEQSATMVRLYEKISSRMDLA